VARRASIGGAVNEEALRRARLLVDAARADEPPAGAADRTLLAMGVSAGAILAGAKAAAAAQIAAAGGTAAVKSVATSLLLKGLAVGALAGVVGMAVSRSSRDKVPPTRSPTTASASAVAGPSTPSTPVTPPRASSSSSEPAPALPVPVLVRTGEAPGAAPSTAPAEIPDKAPTSVGAEQIAAERALLDTARQALDAGRASTAIKVLNDYEQRFGFGLLGHEALVLKMKALQALGRPAEATRLGEHYLREQPNGTQAGTVRRLLQGPGPASSAPAPASDQNSQRRP